MMKREPQKTLRLKPNIYKHFSISHRYLLTHLLTYLHTTYTGSIFYCVPKYHSCHGSITAYEAFICQEFKVCVFPEIQFTLFY